MAVVKSVNEGTRWDSMPGVVLGGLKQVVFKLLQWLCSNEQLYLCVLRTENGITNKSVN